jgi:8-oxo-dGTP pyrophosphatase MutT (NUDIX family)
MTPHDVRQTLGRYILKYPQQAPTVADLLTLIASGVDVLSRSEFRGHVTASVLLINTSGQLLLIKHNALNRWLQPGGHLDASDPSPHDGALRELSEETGIDPSQVSPILGWESTPLWIDRHWIPENPRKNEPRHEHWDLQFLLLTSTTSLKLQTAEVSDHAWRPPQDLSPLTATLIKTALG